SAARRPAVEEADGPGGWWRRTRRGGRGRGDGVDRLADEPRWTSGLRGTAGEVCSLPPPAEGVVRRLELVAGAHYRRLWLQCTEEEQLLLAQLVSEGRVNPRDWHVAQGRRRTGLVRVTPAARPRNTDTR